MAMRKIVGWWSLDTASVTLINTKTGQELRFGGVVADDLTLRLRRTAERRWTRFDYRDSKSTYPLLIEQRNLLIATNHRPMVWRLDHVRSAQLWRRESGSPEEHPSYGLWRRVDDCLIDALSAWPATDVAGFRPRIVSLEGGWRASAWRTDCYRRFNVSELAPDIRGRKAADLPVIHEPLLETDEAPVPASWEFVAGATHDDSTRSDWGFVRRPDGAWWLPASTTFRDERLRRPHLRSTDGRRFLIPIGRDSDACAPLPYPHSSRRLLYVDDLVHGDCLEVSPRHDPSSPFREWSLVATDSSARPFIDRKSGKGIDLVLGPPLRLGTLPPSRSTYLPNRLVLQLRQVLADAWLQWQSGQPEGAAVDVVSVLLSSPIGGSEESISLEMTASIADKEAGKPHPHAIFHSEPAEPPAVGRSRSVGWWDIDRDSGTLINVTSGQRFWLETEVRGDSSKNAAGERIQWLIYEDHETRLPIQLRLLGPAAYGGLSDWQIDYGASVERWPAEMKTSTRQPIYGAWRRVADRCLDALACWPDTAQLGLRRPAVAAVGGYLNGVWSAGLRQELLAKELDNRLAEPSRFAAELWPLSRPAPQAWRYVDVRAVASKAKLAHLVVSPDGRRSLPANAPLEGFQGIVPHSLRHDGRAAFFPLEARSSLYRGEDYIATGYFMYVAEDMFFNVFVERGPNGEWDLRVGANDIGSRSVHRSEDSTKLLAEIEATKGTENWALPEALLCEHFARTFADICLGWSGTRRRLLDDPDRLAEHARRTEVPDHAQSGIALDRGSGVSIHGALIAGSASRGSLQTFYTADQKPARDAFVEEAFAVLGIHEDEVIRTGDASRGGRGSGFLRNLLRIVKKGE